MPTTQTTQKAEAHTAEQSAKHTPKWTLHLFGNYISLPSSIHRGHRVITVVEQTPLTEAAPELLEALKGMVEAYDGEDGDGRYEPQRHEKEKAIIAKAEKGAQ